MNLSVCYITKNEEKNIEKSLASIKAAADEIVVVDTGSRDKTKAIAASYGAKVYDYEWRDDFSAARNYAIELAAGDYILFMDADEYVAADSCRNLRRVLERSQTHAALLMKRYDIDKDEKDILGEIFVLRAFKRQANLRYQGRIHEELRADGDVIEDLAVADPKELILYHTGYKAAVNKSKAERNLRILQQELIETDKPGRLYMYLAEACRGVGDMVQMEHYARLDIAQGRRMVAFASRSYRLLLAALAEQGRAEERRQLVQKAVEDFPELPEFWAEFAACQAEVYDYAAAIRAMKKALQCDKDYPAVSLEPREFDEAMRGLAQEKLAEWSELCQKAGELRITACIIAKNEAAELRDWLKQAAVFSDEIILVDTGSTDDTAAIAAQAGARVFSFPWQNDFAAARNFALDEVSADCDWVVFLDADETFYAPERVRGCLAFLQLHHPETEGVQVPIINVDADACGREIQRFRALRIWRHHPSRRYRGAVHEALYADQGEIAQGYIDSLAVRHTGYSTGRIQQKLTRNLRLIVQEMQEQGEKPLHYRYLADCLYGLHEYELAIEYVRRALAAGVETVAGDGELYRLWLHCLRALAKSPQEQLAVIAKAQAAGISDAELLGWQGIIKAELACYGEARPLLEQFIRRASVSDLSAGSNAVSGLLPDAYSALGLCHARQDAGKAAEFYQQALRRNPYHEETLARLYECGGKTPAEWLNQVLPFFPHQQQARKFLADWAVRFGYGRIAQLLTAELPLNQQHLLELLEHGQLPQAGEKAQLEAGIYIQELFAALVSMPADKRQLQAVDCKEWAAMLPAPLERVAARLYGWRQQLSADDFSGYMTGLAAMQGFAGDGQYEEYAGLALDFAWEQVREVAIELARQQHWQAAYSLLASIPAEEIGDGAVFWYHTGICLYYLEEFAAAQECLAKAAAAGCTELDLPAYQKWLQCREEQA